MSNFPPEYANTDRKPFSKKPWVGITLRITLAAWIVTAITLLIFVSLITPQQKRIFLDQLESKANSVALSVHDATAGAAINEDYASVISSAQTMLEGDPSIDFLIVMKNDGYSLIIEQNNWRAERVEDPYWLKTGRVASGKIDWVDLFNRRVFHFAKPFDYSGIQWGWIHVGLSLDDYDRSIKNLYRNTLILGFGCMVFSFLISWFYSRQVIRPVLRLRAIVQKIAGGDLSVRAERFRRDEIGSLAKSVNTMTNALLRRDRILESVRFAAQQFMSNSQWQDVIISILAKIGTAAGASRAMIFEYHLEIPGKECFSTVFNWVAEGTPKSLSTPHLRKRLFEEAGLKRWLTLFKENQIVCGPVSELPEKEKNTLAGRNVLSLLTIPVFVEGKLWGALGFDDCRHEREWTNVEIDSLRAGADMFGAAIARKRTEEELLEAKATLERRVQERTSELQTQVAAKETALKELAETQSSLVEASRSAGMAEVATGVLHNVGNVLNSVNVSCTILMDQLRESRVKNLSQVVKLVSEHETDLGHFFTRDERGQKVPIYLDSLARTLEEENQIMKNETEALRSRIEHIKEIVAMQQNYGRVSGVSEAISVKQLLEDALALNLGALTRHHIKVHREYEETPLITVDKHTVLQILLNLINNAKFSCTDTDRKDKTITLKITNHSPGRVKIKVEDNGIGIPKENITRIFQHGFTTRKTGHGFGLHSGALAARQLGGSLNAHSDGPGCGAVFTLELPCNSGENYVHK